MKAPFPYFGGKSVIAPAVWERFGDTPNYVEPFFGSGAMLLARPDEHEWWSRTETVNDKDGFVANLWRAIQADPDAVAGWADWPVSENDLHARHGWLVQRRDDITARLEGDPDWYDAKVAGWWLWGICLWIGSGWCSGEGPWTQVDGQLAHLGDAGQGINRQLAHLGDAGRGINRKREGGPGQCEEWSEHLRGMMADLSNRLRRVRICSGDWSRVCGPTPTEKLGLTAVFLDPPYSHEERQGDLYAHEMACADDVRRWSIERGDNPAYRIALCGYEGEHDMPASWERLNWKAKGGYGSQGEGRGRENAAREVVWFSPHCLRPDRARQLDMFEVPA